MTGFTQRDLVFLNVGPPIAAWSFLLISPARCLWAVFFAGDSSLGPGAHVLARPVLPLLAGIFLLWPARRSHLTRPCGRTECLVPQVPPSENRSLRWPWKSAFAGDVWMISPPHRLATQPRTYPVLTGCLPPTRGSSTALHPPASGCSCSPPPHALSHLKRASDFGTQQPPPLWFFFLEAFSRAPRR